MSKLPRVKRRYFLGWFGVGVLASYLPTVLAACGPKNQKQSQQSPSAADSASDSPSNNEGFQAIGTVEQLEDNGQLLAEQAAAQPVLVVRTDGSLSAVNPTCPHRGCTVAWQQQQQVFSCPCHGSEFDAQGQLMSEPATQSLPSYPVKTQGDRVLVKSQSG